MQENEILFVKIEKFNNFAFIVHTFLRQPSCWLKTPRYYDNVQQKLLFTIDKQRTANVCLFLVCFRSVMKKIHNLTVGMSVFVNVNNNILKSLLGRHKKLRLKRKKPNHTLADTIFYFLHTLLFKATYLAVLNTFKVNNILCLSLSRTAFFYFSHDGTQYILTSFIHFILRSCITFYDLGQRN